MTESQSPVTPKTLAFLACRILGLYILFWGLAGFAGLLLNITQFSWIDDPAFNQPIASYVKAFLIESIYLISFVILWFGANWLSDRMIPPPQNNEKSQMFDMNQLSAVIIASVGLIFMVYAASLVPKAILTFNEATEHTDKLSPALLGFFMDILLKFILGFLLVMGSSQVSRLIRFARNY